MVHNVERAPISPPPAAEGLGLPRDPHAGDLLDRVLEVPNAVASAYLAARDARLDSLSNRLYGAGGPETTPTSEQHQRTAHLATGLGRRALGG